MNKPLRNFSVAEYKTCYVFRRYLIILNLGTYAKGEYLPTMFIFLKRNSHPRSSKNGCSQNAKKIFRTILKLLTNF